MLLESWENEYAPLDCRGDLDLKKMSDFSLDPGINLDYDL